MHPRPIAGSPLPRPDVRAAEHWRHLRTTNPIASPFAAVRARMRQTKGAGSRKAGLAMAALYPTPKLALGVESHWRKVLDRIISSFEAAGSSPTE